MGSMAATNLQTDYPNWFIFLFLIRLHFLLPSPSSTFFPYSLDTFFFLIHQTDAKADISMPTFFLLKPCNLVLNEEEF